MTPRRLSPARPLGAALLLSGLAACASGAKRDAGPTCPIPGAVLADHLIQPGEEHFAHLWQVTTAGENAEAYWSFDGKHLCLQVTSPANGWECDRIFFTDDEGSLQQLSDGRGVTTCSYYLPDGERVLYATTGADHADCPPKPDRSKGYVWPLHPEYDIVVQRPGEPARLLVGGPGYDAEATVSPTGDRIVFTSTRSGDIELWTCDLEGGDLRQVTDAPGYDGGAFFSHDGRRLVFRATAFGEEQPEQELAAYRALLAEGLVRPSRMELFVVDADGSNRRQVTNLGNANFAPSFTPDDRAVIFSTNHHDPERPAMNFDLFLVDLESGALEQVTFFDGERGKQFDGFPLFSPDGRFLAFSSNRGDAPAGDTNVFVAEWR